MKQFPIALLATFCLVTTAVAQKYPGPLQGPTVLVPLLVKGQPGAHGSLWNTELTAFNTGRKAVSLFWSCVMSGCIYHLIEPGEAETIPSFTPTVMPGMYFSAWDGLDDIRFYLRVYDESRSDSNWGTWIPVVRWDTLCATQVDFINVPNDPQFRHTLRLYTGVGRSSTVVVRYFDTGNGALLHEEQAVFAGATYLGAGYAQLSSESVPIPDHVARFRIEAQIAADQGPLWGLVTVTNNETQAVTIVPANEKHCPSDSLGPS